jgi:uncharacterized membrane protein
MPRNLLTMVLESGREVVVPIMIPFSMVAVGLSDTLEWGLASVVPAYRAVARRGKETMMAVDDIKA